MARRRFLSVLLLPVLLVGVACGDDDGAGPDAPPTPTSTAPSGATPSPAVDEQLAEILARRPAYFIYEVGTGDTLEAIAGMFDGDGDEGPLAEDLRVLNQLPSAAVTAGQLLAVPLTGFDDVAMMPEASMAAALDVGGASAIRLFRPSAGLRDELFLGRVALHRVRLVRPATGVQPGYLLEFAETDRPAFKGGQLDPDARTGPMAFIIAAGSLAGDIEPPPGGTIHRFTAGGVAYAVVAPQRGPDAAAIAELLEDVGAP
ncbi:MAG: hypothetical protein Kow0010_14370 [Dehalococcoidia bacterium]